MSILYICLEIGSSIPIWGFPGGFPGGSEIKASACKAVDLGSIPRRERSPGEGNGNPLQYSCLENPMDGAAWWATVHSVAKSRTRLSDFTHSLYWFSRFHIYVLIYDICFCFWLTSLSITDSRSIYISTNDPVLFLSWLTNIPLYICTISSLPIHRSLGIQVVSVSGLLYIVLQWTLGNLCLFELFSQGICPVVGIAGSYGTSVFSFLRNPHSILHRAVSIYIPTNSASIFHFFHRFSNLLFVAFLMLAILTSMRWCLITHGTQIKKPIEK